MTHSSEVNWPKTNSKVTSSKAATVTNLYQFKVSSLADLLIDPGKNPLLGHRVPVLGQNAKVQHELSTHKLRVDTFDKAH